MEGKNIFVNLVLLVALIVFVFIGFALIHAIDTLRFRAEKVIEELAKLDAKISGIERMLVGGMPVKNLSDRAKRSFGENAEIANKDYYDPEAEPGGRLIFATSADTKNMNAIINNEAFVSAIWGYAYDSLCERNFEHPEIFEPKLAESWSLSEDKMTYTIKLRKGILWHDFTDPVNGKKWENIEVVADDFKFYVDVIKNEDVDCAPMRSYLMDIDRIEVVSDYEFKVIWKKPYFLSESITLGLSPLPRHLYHSYEGTFDGKKFNDDHERNRMLVGCGPYRFLKWEKDQRIILKRWDKYYGAKYGIMPAIETLAFEIIKDSNTRLQSLIAGKIDRMDLTPEQWVKRTSSKEFDEETGIIKKFKYPGRSY
ncbi:MAG: ABC transporter substrate-binding protein, partial [Candidatus Nanoarchaeia archaeon]